MVERIHAGPCAVRYMDAEAKRAAFRQRWPHACRECAARGGFYLPDLVRGKDVFEPCEECYAVGLCPRCGEALRDFEASQGECSNCGWSGPDNGEPLYPACLGCPPAEVRHE